MYSVEEMKKLANVIRYDTLKAIHVVGSGHPGLSFSSGYPDSVVFSHLAN